MKAEKVYINITNHIVHHLELEPFQFTVYEDNFNPYFEGLEWNEGIITFTAGLL